MIDELGLGRLPVVNAPALSLSRGGVAILIGLRLDHRVLSPHRQMANGDMLTVPQLDLAAAGHFALQAVIPFIGEFSALIKALPVGGFQHHSEGKFPLLISIAGHCLLNAQSALFREGGLLVAELGLFLRPGHYAAFNLAGDGEDIPAASTSLTL